MSDELKPCPLCGNEEPYFDGQYAWCSEKSTDCALSRWPSDLEQWNTRPIEDALRARCKKLEAERRRDALDGQGAMDECHNRIKALEKVGELYFELLYAVGHKYPGETRHETALRYLRAAEQPSIEGASDKAHDAPAPEKEKYDYEQARWESDGPSDEGDK